MIRKKIPGLPWGIEESSVYQFIYREGFREGFRETFERTFRQQHPNADDATMERRYQTIWHEVLIKQLQQLITERYPNYELMRTAAQQSNNDELEKIWLDFGDIRDELTLCERLGQLVAERNQAADARQ